MVRINRKVQSIQYDSSIKKSNELSMAKLNKGLSLNQMQLLAFSIFCTQNDGKPEFKKKEFQERFGLQNYNTRDAYEDSSKISSLLFSTSDLENNSFRFTPVFSDIIYKNGLFQIEWNSKFVPHILELKQKFVVTDLSITAQFKSSYSWILYDYLKALYGYWHRKFSKDAMLRLFGVEDKRSYIQNTAQFKRSVLHVAIEEINKFTELEVWYEDIKSGNKITGFLLHWSTGKQISVASSQQLILLDEIKEEITKNILDYMSIKDTQLLDTAQKHIDSFRRLYIDSRGDLTSDDADKYIKEARQYYKFLENLLETDGQKRDTSFYYNWLEENSD